MLIIPIILMIYMLGLCLGSFINVVALRSVAGRDWVYESSCCFSCKKRLKFTDNIPLYGWLRHGGLSSCCDTKIPKRYIIVEGILGVLTVLIVSLLTPKMALILSPFFILGCIIFLTDWEGFHIPDWASLGGIVLGLLFSLFSMPYLPNIQMSFLGVIWGAGLLYMINFLYRLWRGYDGLGMGDVKLMAMFGAWFGPFAILPILFFSSFLGAIVGITSIMLGLIVGKKKDEYINKLPFGCFLVPMSFLWIFMDVWFHEWMTLPMIFSG